MHRQIISDEIFNEIKQEAIKIWETYNATDKINQVQDIDNIRDNYQFIIGMFDTINKSKLYSNLSSQAKEVFNA